MKQSKLYRIALLDLLKSIGFDGDIDELTIHDLTTKIHTIDYAELLYEVHEFNETVVINIDMKDIHCDNEDIYYIIDYDKNLYLLSVLKKETPSVFKLKKDIKPECFINNYKKVLSDIFEEVGYIQDLKTFYELIDMSDSKWYLYNRTWIFERNKKVAREKLYKDVFIGETLTMLIDHDKKIYIFLNSNHSIEVLFNKNE